MNTNTDKIILWTQILIRLFSLSTNTQKIIFFEQKYSKDYFLWTQILIRLFFEHNTQKIADTSFFHSAHLYSSHLYAGIIEKKQSMIRIQNYELTKFKAITNSYKFRTIHVYLKLLNLMRFFGSYHPFLNIFSIILFYTVRP